MNESQLVSFIIYKTFHSYVLTAETLNCGSLSLQRHYSPGWASASFKSFLHPFRFRAKLRLVFGYLKTLV